MGSPSARSSKPFSISLAGNTAPTSKLPVKRSRATAFANDHEDADDEDGHGPQAVSGFGENGAVIVNDGSKNKKVKKEPLVIPVQKDADWRRRGAGKNLLPPEVQAQQREEAETAAGASVDERVEQEKPAQYGLLVQAQVDAEEKPARPDDGAAASPGPAPQQSKSIEDQAYDRLVNNEERRSALVIPGTDREDGETNGFASRRHEEGDFRTDVASRPESSTIADYEAIPIEDFGAAMLRGMGWKEGGGIGRARKNVVQPKALERRPNLLGIGAKHVPEGLEELGAWGKGAVKGPKTRETYNPVVLKNAKTGETLTEEEKTARDRRAKEEAAERASKREWNEVDGNVRRYRKEDKDSREKDFKTSKYDSDRYESDSWALSRRRRNKSRERTRRHRSRSRDYRESRDTDRRKETHSSHRHQYERYDERSRHRTGKDLDDNSSRRRYESRDDHRSSRSHN